VAGDTFLKPGEFQKMPLVEKIIVNHDTRIFRFGLPRPDMKLGLPTGGHIFLKGKWEDKVVMRPYSPMTDDDTLGHVDFIIKVYFKNVHPRFPEGGKMSQHLDSLKIGDTIEAKGPLGEFVYEEKGKFTWEHKPRYCKNLSLIAGGTGISLPYQVASKVLSDPNDPTKVKLLFANQTPDDILAKDYIDELLKKYPDRFEVSFTVDRVPETYAGEWKGEIGFINDAMISRALFPASEDTVCLMCGPPIMYEKACIPNLLKIGYSKDNIFEG
jgi:NAD(P)H-flavin reductase